ncbi:MAG TPA: Gfo/Idh/MocA family oxidoreductase, partial [Spirochaetia bacterium]|nr:Gfo/Idh/MocA family oxidoreductase [Spirochaetia bacterium]
MKKSLRIGIVGAGRNTRSRHIPGLRAIPGVEISAVCNRTRESSERAARELGIPRVYPTWEELVRAEEVDAVVIGTWPYMHCPITVAAIEAGKHVLCEARMAMNGAEA